LGEVSRVIRLQRTGVEVLGSIGLEWSTLGLGLVGLVIASPTARKGARALAVAALTGGIRLAQGISAFGGQIRQEMAQAAGQAQPQAHTEPQAEQPAMFAEAPVLQ
jgi:hypothetical protein